MANPPEASSRQAVAAKPGGLLTTKLYVPRLPPGFVSRPRLVEQLDDGLTRGLTLVCAPAGFGKTSLLADWCRRRQGPVAWLSLDTGDNDQARFWRHVAAAVDQVRPGVAEWVAPLLGPPAPASFEGAITELINELSAGSGEVLLVLDDYHVIDAPEVHASVAFLLQHQPPGLHVVVASRADPPLPLPRRRARGRLAELRAAGLRFTADEAGSLLRAAVGPDVGARLGEDEAAALAARTEGWAAGLQLAALSLLGEPDIAAFVASFSGSHRYVLDYLTSEVLEQQPEPVREFLLETSVLERLSGPLCDAVTGRGDGQAMLETIEAASLFLSPLDDVRGWWRYHHLFTDLLRARLQRNRPERVLELHRNAAAWHEAHGTVEDAVHHTLAAHDPTWAARLVERHFDAVLRDSEVATMRRWLAALPPEVVASRPRLLLAQAIFALLAGRLAQGADLLEAVERAWPQVADEPFEPSVGRAASQLANVPAAIAVGRAHIAHSRGDAEQTTEFASQALAELAEGEWMLNAVNRDLLTTAEWLRGQVGTAERDMISQAATWRSLDRHFLAVWASTRLGMVQYARGRLDTAAETYREALEADSATVRVRAMPAAGVAYVGLAEVAYQRDELDVARRQLAEGLPLCRQFVYSQSLARGLATQAWIRQAQGDAAAAAETINEAAAVAPDAVVDLLNPAPSQRARLLLTQGDVEAAAQWVAERGLRADDEPSYPHELAHLVLARVLLAQDRPGHALQLLDRLLAAANADGRAGSVIEIQALRALAYADHGAEGEALAALTEALALAHPQGFVRIFADEGPPMAALLGRLIAARHAERSADHGVPVEYLGRLMRAFRHQEAGPVSDGATRATTVAGLVTGLSGRELEVLRLLAAGRQNQEIADQLYVAVNTVKKHVTHILEKLGAANRTEATARARELGLLP